MSASLRFPVAVHVLTLLASKPGEVQSSEWIAGSVNTNPVVVRRLLAVLGRAGLVRARAGRDGGFELAADPGEISLRRVWEAVESRHLLSVHAEPSPLCPVGREIKALLGQISQGAEEAFLAHLAQSSIAGLIRKIQA